MSRFADFRLKRKPPPINYPVTSLLLQRKGNEYIRIGCASMHGTRDTMEDAHVAILKLPSHNKSFIGVYDGHSGAMASDWCSKKIHEYIDQIEEFTDENIIRELYKADAEFIKTEYNSHGSCAVMALIDVPEDSSSKERDLIVLNIGDSRCVVGTRNSEACCLTTDHHTDLQSEQDRIVGAGGFVARNKVDSFLSVTRSFGDSGFKNNENLSPECQKVVPHAEIKRHTISCDEFLLLCCDGIFETFTNESAIDFIRNALRNNNDDPAYVASKLIEEAFKNGSQDNLTAILVQFKDGTGYTKGDEFIPGIWQENGNETFVKAYKDFAEKCGSTLEEAKQKWEASNRTNLSNSSSSTASLSGSTSTPKLITKDSRRNRLLKVPKNLGNN